jgi:hypothetical protein
MRTKHKQYQSVNTIESHEINRNCKFYRSNIFDFDPTNSVMLQCSSVNSTGQTFGFGLSRTCYNTFVFNIGYVCYISGEWQIFLNSVGKQ